MILIVFVLAVFVATAVGQVKDAKVCSRASMEGDHRTLAMMDSLRHRAYWLDEDPVQGNPAANLLILRSDRFVGFCSAILDRCGLYSGLGVDKPLEEVKASHFDPIHATGRWLVTRSDS